MTTTPTTIAATVKTPAHMKGWHLSAGDEHVVFDARNEHIVNVQCGGMTGRKYGEASDIARLIAAAPALLEALEKANTLLTKAVADIVVYRIIAGKRSSKSATAEYVEAINAFDAALSTATGEA